MKFAKTHEWVKAEGENATIGISDHAQSELSDIVFVDFPAIGNTVSKGDVLLTIDSVKAASDVYAPVSGEVVEINQTLEDQPELVNSSPESEGWLVKIKLSNPSEVDELLSQEEYKNSLD